MEEVCTPKVGGALPHTEGWGRFCSYRSCCGFQTVRSGQLLIKIPPCELADLLVRSEQTTIGEQTAEVEVGVEGFDVLEHSCHISDRLVKCGLLPALGDLRDGIGEASSCIGWLQDGREALALVVEGGRGEEAREVVLHL